MLNSKQWTYFMEYRECVFIFTNVLGMVFVKRVGYSANQSNLVHKRLHSNQGAWPFPAGGFINVTSQKWTNTDTSHTHTDTDTHTHTHTHTHSTQLFKSPTYNPPILAGEGSMVYIVPLAARRFWVLIPNVYRSLHEGVSEHDWLTHGFPTLGSGPHLGGRLICMRSREIADLQAADILMIHVVQLIVMSSSHKQTTNYFFTGMWHYGQMLVGLNQCVGKQMHNNMSFFGLKRGVRVKKVEQHKPYPDVLTVSRLG